MSVYAALIEVAPLKGSELDPEQVSGAFTIAYAEAESEEAARERIPDALAEMKVKLVQEEWISQTPLTDEDGSPWDNPDADADSNIEQAAETGKVIFSQFTVWGPNTKGLK